MSCGYWYDNLQDGARMLGTICGLEYLPIEGKGANILIPVVSEANTQGERLSEKPYTIEMLEPEKQTKKRSDN